MKRKKGLKVKLLKRVRSEIYVKKIQVFGYSFFEIIFPGGSYYPLEMKADSFKTKASMEIVKDLVRKLRINLARDLYKKRKLPQVKEDIINI
jgi:hypothetical protein